MLFVVKTTYKPQVMKTTYKVIIVVFRVSKIFKSSNLSQLFKALPKSCFPVKLVWVGLEKAGKTSLIQRLKTGAFFTDIPRTMGLTVNKLFYEADSNLEIISWDLGGQVSFRENLWQEYLKGANAIIYVIDLSEIQKERIQESKRELWHYVLDDKNNYNIPILILANKADLNKTISKESFYYDLELGKAKNKNIELFEVSALTGMNLDLSFSWLFTTLVNSSNKPKKKKK